MKINYLALGLPFVFSANVALADSPSYEQVSPILQANTCLACHQVENKVVGPGYREIAEKYKDDPDNAKDIAHRIKNGSSGEWGSIPMPANSGISDEDITIVVDWLMAGAPN